MQRNRPHGPKRGCRPRRDMKNRGSLCSVPRLFRSFRPLCLPLPPSQSVPETAQCHCGQDIDQSGRGHQIQGDHADLQQDHGGKSIADHQPLDDIDFLQVHAAPAEEAQTNGLPAYAAEGEVAKRLENHHHGQGEKGVEQVLRVIMFMTGMAGSSFAMRNLHWKTWLSLFGKYLIQRSFKKNMLSM